MGLVTWLHQSYIHNRNNNWKKHPESYSFVKCDLKACDTKPFFPTDSMNVVGILNPVTILQV